MLRVLPLPLRLFLRARARPARPGRPGALRPGPAERRLASLGVSSADAASRLHLLDLGAGRR